MRLLDYLVTIDKCMHARYNMYMITHKSIHFISVLYTLHASCSIYDYPKHSAQTPDYITTQGTWLYYPEGITRHTPTPDDMSTILDTWLDYVRLHDLTFDEDLHVGYMRQGYPEITLYDWPHLVTMSDGRVAIGMYTYYIQHLWAVTQDRDPCNSNSSLYHELGHWWQDVGNKPIGHSDAYFNDVGYLDTMCDPPRPE